MSTITRTSITVLFISFFSLLNILLAAYLPATVGFPGVWYGDNLKNEKCEAVGVPVWLNGYFLMQLSASYGSAGPEGTHLTHMFDGLGAVVNFKFQNGQVHFSAEFYPTLAFKIWDFYHRDMHRSTVAWLTSISAYNATARERWARIAPKTYLEYNPNIDFWRIGSDIVAATEIPELGLRFDVETLTDFKPYPFQNDDTDNFFDNKKLRPMGLAIHGRRDQITGMIWSVIPAYEYESGKTYSIIFTVSDKGTRKVQAKFSWGTLDQAYCDGVSGDYTGDIRALPGYMHSITSTKDYLILPASSALLNPCPKPRPPNKEIIKPQDNKLHVNQNMPLRFLIYNKNKKNFLPVLEGPKSRWPSHQLNAYQDPKDPHLIFADMLIYDNMDAYNKYLTVGYLQSRPYPQVVRAVRYMMDLRSQIVYENSLLPNDKLSLEYPEINHAFEERPYQWAYALQHPYTIGSSIAKINVNEPTGRKNSLFQPSDSEALSEPCFIARPGAVAEDDGILLTRGINMKEGKSVVHIIDARIMRQIGLIFSPIQLPFGFHNRFFSFAELGSVPKEKTYLHKYTTPQAFDSVIPQSSSQLRYITISKAAVEVNDKQIWSKVQSPTSFYQPVSTHIFKPETTTVITRRKLPDLMTLLTTRQPIKTKLTHPYAAARVQVTTGQTKPPWNPPTTVMRTSGPIRLIAVEKPLIGGKDNSPAMIIRIQPPPDEFQNNQATIDPASANAAQTTTPLKAVLYTPKTPTKLVEEWIQGESLTQPITFEPPSEIIENRTMNRTEEVRSKICHLLGNVLKSLNLNDFCS